MMVDRIEPNELIRCLRWTKGGAIRERSFQSETLEKVLQKVIPGYVINLGRERDSKVDDS